MNTIIPANILQWNHTQHQATAKKKYATHKASKDGGRDSRATALCVPLTPVYLHALYVNEIAVTLIPFPAQKFLQLLDLVCQFWVQIKFCWKC